MPTTATTPPRPARLYLIADAVDEEGLPRIALAMPAEPCGRLPPLVVFKTMTAALAALRQAEAGR
jgi:hypothetical protein